jgi:hypothetical protein
MVVERNGILFFPTDEDFSGHPAFEALQTVSLGDVRFPFGFYLVDEDGQRHVVPATEEARAKVLRKAFPEICAEVLAVRCFPNSSGPGCSGDCSSLPPIHRCMRAYDGSDLFYSCACVDWT